MQNVRMFTMDNTAQYQTVQYRVHNTVLDGLLQYSIKQDKSIQLCSVQCSTVQYGTGRCGTVRYRTGHGTRYTVHTVYTAYSVSHTVYTAYTLYNCPMLVAQNGCGEERHLRGRVPSREQER